VRENQRASARRRPQESQPSPGLREIRQVENTTEYVLPNGLTVLLQPDNSRPTTSVNITYRVGSRHEAYGESGAAHLLEHMLFKASETIADHKLEMTRRGARWNGTTGYDRTSYFAQFSSDAETLDWMLGWLAESMTRARVSQQDLASEMTVVRNGNGTSRKQPRPRLGMLADTSAAGSSSNRTFGCNAIASAISTSRCSP